MRIVVQRGRSARVTVDGSVVGELPRPGLVVFVGVTHTDTAEQADWLAGKCWDLRVLPDEKSASDIDAPILAISNFTLYANARKGRRPAWNNAAPGPVAEPIFDEFVAALRRRGAHVETGTFGAMMDVEMVNDGPLTLVLDADATP